ncbi:MAG: non-canonical purine NTP pyrophosphatase, partial [Deltaproteobacteria bacterium]
SARFAGPEATDEENNLLLIEKLRNVREAGRKAWFSCVAVFYYADNRYFICEGRVYGVITDRPGGSGGFGYDPLFFIPELGKTMAELPLEVKNRLSHRGRALKALKLRLREFFP